VKKIVQLIFGALVKKNEKKKRKKQKKNGEWE